MGGVKIMRFASQCAVEHVCGVVCVITCRRRAWRNQQGRGLRTGGLASRWQAPSLFVCGLTNCVSACWRVRLVACSTPWRGCSPAALGEAGGAQLDWWSASGGSRGAGASPGQTLQMYVRVSPSACAFFILVDSASDAGGEAMEELWNAMVPEAAELLRMPGKAERNDPWMSRSQMRDVSRTGHRESGAMVSSSHQPRFAFFWLGLVEFGS